MHYLWQMAIPVGYILISIVCSMKSKFKLLLMGHQLPSHLRAEGEEKVEEETGEHLQTDSRVGET